MIRTAILRQPSGNSVGTKRRKKTFAGKVGSVVKPEVKKIDEHKYAFDIKPIYGTIKVKLMDACNKIPSYVRGSTDEVMGHFCRSALLSDYGTFFSFEKPFNRISASFFKKYGEEFRYISLHETYSDKYWFLYLHNFSAFVRVDYDVGTDLVSFYPLEAGTKADLDAAVKWLSKAAHEFFVPLEQKIEETHTIDLLSSGPNGVLRWVNKSFDGKLCDMDQFKIGLNYGEKFLATHNLITSNLMEKANGIYLFNGPPGTGKTTYIKHLIGAINKNFLYVPEQLIKDITSPQFTNMLLQQEDSVLILEDAERAITKRDSASATSAISNILNMSDGIVGSILKMPIIITFNCELKEIDSAILRKGRCVCNHTFGPLEPSAVKKLAKKIGKTIPKDVSDRPMTLADIYNYGE